MTTLRMGGLASGMDTEAIVSAMLEAERIPRIRLENRIVEEQDKLAAWSSLDTSLNSLYGKTQQLTSYSTWKQMKVSSGDAAVVTGLAETTAASGVYEVNVTHLATSHRIASDAQSGSSTPLGLEGDFSIGGQNVAVALTDTLAVIRDKINAAATDMDDDRRVSASIVNTSLVIRRVATGSSQIELADGSAGVLKSMGVLDAGEAVKNELQEALDLAATVDGIAVARAGNTGLSDIVSGVTFHFQGEGATTLGVARDTASIRTLIDEFVAAYNDAMEVAEDYSKVDLTEDGEGVSSNGLLQGEGIVNNLKFRGRNLLTRRETDPAILEEPFNSLQAIGIWTTSRDNRLAVVDEARLMDALENNFGEVEELVRGWDGGVVRRFDDYLDSLISPIDGAIGNRTESLEKSITASNQAIAAIDDRLTRLETELWEQFSRMEDALASINQQANFLMASLGLNSNTSSSNKSS